MYDEPATPEPEEPAKGYEGKDEQETALLPKSVFRGKDLKAGDKETVEVVHIYSDEVEVRCVGKYKDDEKPRESVASKLDAMAAMNQE